ATAPQRPWTSAEVKAADPQVIVVNGGAARVRSDPAWQAIPAVAAGRVYEWPALPYSWGSRPPSVNRLPGVLWLAYVARGRSFDAGFNADLRALFKDIYHLELTDQQIAKLLAP